MFLGDFFSLHIQNWNDPHKIFFSELGSVYEVSEPGGMDTKY